MTLLVKPLTAYTAWLCRALGVTPARIKRIQERNGSGFSPRPEGALGRPEQASALALYLDQNYDNQY